MSDLCIIYHREACSICEPLLSKNQYYIADIFFTKNATPEIYKSFQDVIEELSMAGINNNHDIKEL